MISRFFFVMMMLLCGAAAPVFAQTAAPVAQPQAAAAQQASSSAASSSQAPQMTDMNIAVLRTIDKVSARTRTFEVPVNKTVRFGQSLFIRVRACRQSLPLEQPENAAFLQIWEKSPSDGKSRWVFSGWMFSSNPSLSAMENPVYDIWVLDCKNKVTSAKAQVFSSEKAPDEAPDKGDAASGKTPEPAPVAAPVPAKNPD